MAKEKILVVDDERDILNLVEYNLSKENYRVHCVETGEDALEAARSINPDLMLLDWMLPGLDGLEVCKILKYSPETAKIPIIMLTAKGEESDIITGLEVGADDYISKPFSPKILLARVRATLRKKARVKQQDLKDTIRIHDLVIDPGKFKVHLHDHEIELTFTEFRLLYLLAQRPGWVYSRYQIVEALRGDDYPVTDRSVDVQVVGLRKKLGSAGKFIQTVRGVGYRIKE